MSEIKSLYEIIMNLEEIYKDKPVMKSRKSDGSWQEISAKDLVDKVYKLGMGLDSLGFKKGDKICLMSETRAEWNILDLAIGLMGMINVPIYPTLIDEEINFIIKHSNSVGFIAESEEMFSKIKNKQIISKLNKLIVFDGKSNDEENIINIENLEKIGAENIQKKGIDYANKIGASLKEEDLASIIYTSGTTGELKGVMLSHKNFISNAYGAYYKLNLSLYNDTLVFLPLSHSYSRTCTYGLIIAGLTLWYAENINTLGRDLIEAKPEIMIVVPRVFEKIYRRIVDSMNEGGGIKRSLFHWSRKVAETVAMKNDTGQKISAFTNFKYKIADKIIYSKIRAKTGGRLVFTVSGSAPLAKHIAYFFNGIKLPILEGYGLTEAAPVVSTNTLEKHKVGTVGTTYHNVEVKVAEDNELLVRGPNVMMGYYNNEEKTKEVITPDGWLKTGDIVEIDGDNFIKIIDRKKDLLKTSGGKCIIPQKIENIAKANVYIAEFVVIAEERKFASALILPDFDKIEEYAKENNISYNNNKELINDEKVNQLFQKILDEEINSQLARYETIKKFILIDKPFTVEGGELTPTLKVKRKVIDAHYNDKIEVLYSE